MMKRYMQGELAPDAPKRPNDPMQIDPNSKVNQDQSMLKILCLKWLTKKIINEPWTQEQFYTCHLCRH